MKTPEEIKKGIEYCASHRQCGPDCVYYRDSYECGCPIHTDVLVYTRQLEAQVLKWISVEERLPENDVDVLVYDRLDGVGVCQYSSVLRKFFGDVEGTYAEVTHWMPLPEPPEESFNG